MDRLPNPPLPALTPCLAGPRIANIESRPLSSPPSLFPITLHASLLSRNPNYLPDTFIFIMSDQHRADSIPSRSTLRVGERRASVLLARRRSAARSDCQVQPFLLPPPHVIASERSERSNLTLYDRSSVPKTFRLFARLPEKHPFAPTSGLFFKASAPFASRSLSSAQASTPNGVTAASGPVQTGSIRARMRTILSGITTNCPVCRLRIPHYESRIPPSPLPPHSSSVSDRRSEIVNRKWSCSSLFYLPKQLPATLARSQNFADFAENSTESAPKLPIIDLFYMERGTTACAL